MSGSAVRRRHSVPLAVALFALVMGCTATACAGGGSGRTTTADSGSRGSTPAATAPSEATAQASRSRPRLVRVGRFSKPVEIKAAPGYRKLMFVVEQEGRIMVLRRGKKLKRPFLDIRGRVDAGGERGLLSVAFPPNYRKSKRFYVYYTDHTGDIRVDGYRRRTSIRARHNSRRGVIRIHHRANSNHNGGQMHFLGKNLYFGTGDGGGGGDVPGNAQNLRSLLGKLIRIDPRRRSGRRYSVPRSNPFVGRRGARAEIFSYGLRNPFRWSFDRVTAKRPRIMIADVGQDKFEEVNYLSLARAKGGNFGWNKWEGFSRYDGGRAGTIKPSFVLSHSDSYCSVIGGLLVRDRKLPALRNRIVFSDFCKGAVQTFRPKPGRIRKIQGTGISRPDISSFGESIRGTLYATSLSGPVYRVRQ